MKDTQGVISYSSCGVSVHATIEEDLDGMWAGSVRNAHTNEPVRVSRAVRGNYRWIEGVGEARP